MPVRRIPKNYRSVTGLVASNDERDQVTAYESSLERDCIKHVIFNRNVAWHEEQPVTISFVCDGKQYSYSRISSSHTVTTLPLPRNGSRSSLR
jgi:hypothetical protein